MNRDKQIEEICPCQTDIQACCSCVSMHCDECHKPMQSKFVQGRFCSNCGRPLKAELKREYRKASEVAREIFAEIERETHRMSTPIGKYTVIHNDRYAELKKKYESEGEG